MDRIGIRDLTRRAGDLLRTVTETGEPILITDRGRPVAALVPVEERVTLHGSVLERLHQADVNINRMTERTAAEGTRSESALDAYSPEPVANR